MVTYGQVAYLLPPPAEMEFQTYTALSPRWVGSAMAACPDDVPWQAYSTSVFRKSGTNGRSVTVSVSFQGDNKAQPTLVFD